MSHSCPIKRCPVVALPDEKLMCRKHWFMVPDALRNEVWRAYNQVRDRTGYDHNRLTQLREAQRKAIAFVNAKEGQPA